MPPWVEPDGHATVHHPVGDAGWKQLLDLYSAEHDSPLARVFDAARAGRCRTVVDENRYVDPDYRSEFSAFWSHRFPTTPAFARRLHFFRRQIRDERLHSLPSDPGYLGYSVLRPMDPGRVGRTMITPPPRLKGATLALATDRVSLFGEHLEVTGAPFMEQDVDYLRCAHAAVWMCHYSAVLRGLAGRRLTAELVALSPNVLWHERTLPSPGLTANQIQAVFEATGQPALFYGLSNMPRVEGVTDPPVQPGAPSLWDTRIFSVLCRYLNAGFPVLIVTGDHAFVIVGWFREGTRIRFVACDDQYGPYETIASPFGDRRAPWQAIMVPLPAKVYLSGEVAESTTHFALRAWAATSGAPSEWSALVVRLAAGEISLRTFLRSNLDYKARVKEQGRGDDVARDLVLARLPHWVWVVEAHDRAERSSQRPSVVAEMVFDSTSGDRVSGAKLAAASLPGFTTTFPPDDGTQTVRRASLAPWRSQLT